MAGMDPPTSHLVSIRSIAHQPPELLLSSLRYLRALYNPAVRGTRRFKRIEDTSNRDIELDALQSLRSDAFERAYAIRWLTTVVSRSTNDKVIEEAASLLAACAGTASAGVITRVFDFQRGDVDDQVVTVRVRDQPLDNQDYGTLGNQTWGGASVLSGLIAEKPSDFFSTGSLVGRKSLRVIELGAGTGLVSLAAAKILQDFADVTYTIVATDFKDAVLDNLQHNIKTNFPTSDNIMSSKLDWSIFPSIGNHELPSPFDDTFDIALGADIIYEAQHAKWIKDCLARLLRRSRAPDTALPNFHLLIPLRQTHATEAATIARIFSRSASMDRDELVILNEERIVCNGDTESDVVEYVYYRIGWDIAPI